MLLLVGLALQSRTLAEEWLPALQQLFAGHTLPYLALVANTDGGVPGVADEQEAALGYAGEQLTAAPLAHRCAVVCSGVGVAILSTAAPGYVPLMSIGAATQH
jgi:hypothetical protein